MKKNYPEPNQRIGLITDEGADLTSEIIEKHQIAIVPLKVIWPPEIENLPGETIFHKMREADKKGLKIFCQTSQPSPKDFLDIFKKELEKFEKIICITITSKLSGTYNSAIQAKNFLNQEKKERIFVVDSLNASCGMGLLVLRAIDLIKELKEDKSSSCAEFSRSESESRKEHKVLFDSLANAREGKEIEEIVKDLEILKQKIQLRAFLQDPKWLEHSGRISKTIASWIRRMAKMGVRPLIGIKEGTVKAVGIKTGVRDVSEALFQELEGKTKKARKEGQPLKIAIIHCLNPEGAQKLKEIIEKRLPNSQIAFVNLIDRVVGSIVGLGVVGLAWHEL